MPDLPTITTQRKVIYRMGSVQHSRMLLECKLTSIHVSVTVDASNSSNTTQLHSHQERMIAFGVLAVMSVMGAVGHSLMIHVIRTTSSFSKRFKQLTMNLSVLGLLVSLIAVPTHMVNIFVNHNMYGVLGCQIIGYINMALFLATLSNIVLIAIQRCVMLTKPQTLITSRKRIFLEQLILWIVPLTIALLGLPAYGFSSSQLHCSFQDEAMDTWITAIMIGIPGLAVLIVICSCYVVICCKVSKSKTALRQKSRRRVRPMNTVAHIVVEPQQEFAESTRQGKGRKVSTSLPNLQRIHELTVVTDGENTVRLTDRLASWSDLYSKELKLTVQIIVNCSMFIFTWAPLVTLYAIVCCVDISPTLWLSFTVLARLYSGTSWLIYGIWSKNVRFTLKKIFHLS